MTLIGDLRHALRLLGRSPLFTAHRRAVAQPGRGRQQRHLQRGRRACSAPAAGRARRGAGGRRRPRQRRQRLRQHVASGLRVPPRPRDQLRRAGRGGVRRAAHEPDAGRLERTGLRHLVSANFFEVLGTRAGPRPVLPRRRRRRARASARWSCSPIASGPGGSAPIPRVLDRPLRLNNREFAVVGVAEPGFEGVTLAGTDLWLPMAMVAEARGRATASELTDARGVMHMGVGRLKDGRQPCRRRGRTEHADGAVQGRHARGQSAAHRRRCCRPAACPGRCARRSWSSSACCSRSPARCWPSPAATSPACCWRGPRRGGARWRRAWPSAPAARRLAGAAAHRDRRCSSWSPASSPCRSPSPPWAC